MGVRLSLLLFFWHGFHGLRGFVLGEGRGQRADGGNGGLCKLMLKDLAKVQRRV